MRSKNKRIISVLCYIMAAVFAVGVCLLSASPLKASAAAEGTCGKDLRWTLNGGRLSVSGTGEMTNFSDSNMPPWYSHVSEITNVVIEKGVTSVGELAFFDCKCLTNVVLPDTLNKIGIRSFKDCSRLTYINIPSKLHAIYESAFENCVSLQDIYLEEGLDIIADKAFFRCRSLTSITIPRSVTILGMVVFAYCDSLVRVDIRAPLKELPDWTFYDCSSLVEVALPDELDGLGDDVFHNCADLSTVHYTGEEFDKIEDQVKSSVTGKSDFSGVVNWDIDKKTAGVVSENKEHTQSTYTTVTETENVKITSTQIVDLNSDFKATVINDKINVTLISEEGISDVIEAIDDALETKTELKVKGNTDIKVQLRDNAQISGDELLKYIGKSVSIELIDEHGSSLRLDMKDVKRESIEGIKISPVSFDVTEVENQPGIESSKVYQSGCKNDTEVNSHIGISLGSDNARHYATLFEEDGDSAKPIQNVLIDDDGQASFALANVDQGTKYYVGVDTSGIKFEEVKIPKKMSNEFDLAEEALPDYQQYQLTGRKSRWGITGGQYMLYVGLALGFIIIVVSVIMVSMNKMRQKRALAMGLKPGEKVPSMRELRKQAEAKSAAKEKAAEKKQDQDKN